MTPVIGPCGSGASSCKKNTKKPQREIPTHTHPKNSSKAIEQKEEDDDEVKIKCFNNRYSRTVDGKGQSKEGLGS